MQCGLRRAGRPERCERDPHHEIPPGATTRPVTFTLDDVVYVIEGRGLTTIWAGDGPKKSFEWSKSSIFVVPGGCTYQMSITQGHEPARCGLCARSKSNQPCGSV